MNRPPYVLARSCVQADEVYFHRAHLLLRLRTLAAGLQPVWRPAQLGRASAPHGSAVSVRVPSGRGWRHLGYVLREGWAAEDLSDKLQRHWAELESVSVWGRRAA